MRIIVLHYWLAIFVFLGIPSKGSAEPLEVFAGIPPVANLVERIGGEKVHVTVLMQPGQEAHTFEPSPKQIQLLGRTSWFFKVGMPFEEELLEKIGKAQKDLHIVDTTKGITKRLAVPCTDHDHSHETTKSKHSESDYDPHVWLSPLCAKIQAKNIAEALQQADPDNAETYRSNLKKLDDELDVLHDRIAQRLKPFAGKSIYVFHPAFGYFTDCYHLKQEAVEAGGKQPSLKQIRRLIQDAKTAKARTVFIQPQFDPRTAQTIAQSLGGKVVPMNDMSKDLLANLEEIAEKIETELQEK